MYIYLFFHRNFQMPYEMISCWYVWDVWVELALVAFKLVQSNHQIKFGEFCESQGGLSLNSFYVTHGVVAGPIKI